MTKQKAQEAIFNQSDEGSWEEIQERGEANEKALAVLLEGM
jgi:hypothetical protein